MKRARLERSSRGWLVLLSLVTTCLAGCNGDDSGQPVDYGSPVPLSDVRKAILSGVKDIDTSQLKKGAAVQYTTTQYLAGGQVVNLLSVTQLTITDRQVIPATATSPATVAFALNEWKTSFTPGQKNTEMMREFKLVFNASEGLAATTAANNVRVTYHNLKTSVAQAEPPRPIKARPGCLGIPSCQMTYNNVSFDQVSWKPEGPEKIHFDFMVSPDIPQISGFNMSPIFPFYQGLAKSCVTLMVNVGDGHEKTMLMECQQVQDFLFESPAP